MSKYLVVVEASGFRADGPYRDTENHEVTGDPYKWFKDYADLYNYYSNSASRTYTLLNWLEIPEKG